MQHAGIQVPLTLLAGDPRTTAKGGRIFVSRVLGVGSAFEELVETVHGGASRMQCRLRFARAVHYSEQYDMALVIIDGVLAEEPENREAIVLKADVLVHQEQFRKAADLVDEVLAADPADLDALEAMAGAQEGMKNWQEVVAITTKMLALCADGNPWPAVRILPQRARAKLELGDVAGVKIDIQALRDSGRRVGQRRANDLEKLLAERLGAETGEGSRNG